MIIAFPSAEARADYRLIKDLGPRLESDLGPLPVRVARSDNNWLRAHGTEQWEFDESGLMRRAKHQRRGDPARRMQVPVAQPAAGRRPG
jgi:nuclear transport factor 2 (NTF2) superfamily protein